MTFSSTIQILKVDEPVEKTSPKDQSKYMVYTAQCALLDDNGELQKVGRMRIPEPLREKVKVGIFRGAFTLEVSQYGLSKGDIVAQLADLVPVQVAKRTPGPVAA